MKNIYKFILLTLVAFVVACSGANDSHEGHTDHDHIVNEDGDTIEVPLDHSDHDDMDHSDHDMDSMDMDGIPEDVTFESSKETDGGLYTASLETDFDSLALNEIHTWVLTLTDADGNAVSDATVTLDGGMPEHAHGFPTEPTVTNNEDGTYSVDGVKFQMGGWWQFDFIISGSERSDTVQLNVNVPK